MDLLNLHIDYMNLSFFDKTHLESVTGVKSVKKNIIDATVYSTGTNVVGIRGDRNQC